MRYKISKLLIYAVLLFGAFWMILPFFWMITTSFKTEGEAVRVPPTWIPHHFTIEGYKAVFETFNFLNYIKVSATVTFLNLLAVLLTSVLAAYAFSWFKFKWRETLFTAILSLMIVPVPVYVIPLYIIVQKLNWIDTYYALVVPWAVSIFSIFLLRQHFRSIPRDLYDAAVIDGCGRMRFLFTIILPLTKPALITISIFTIIAAWNAFMWPLMVTNSENMRPIQVALAYFAQGESTNYPALMAASTIAILPLVVLYLIAQKYIVESYARSGLKE